MVGTERCPVEPLRTGSQDPPELAPSCPVKKGPQLGGLWISRAVNSPQKSAKLGGPWAPPDPCGRHTHRCRSWVYADIPGRDELPGLNQGTRIT